MVQGLFTGVDTIVAEPTAVNSFGMKTMTVPARSPLVTVTVSVNFVGVPGATDCGVSTADARRSFASASVVH